MNYMSNARNILFKPPTHNIWKDLHGKKLIAAFSGGKDSITLLHYVWVHRECAGWQLTACHINHGLRGDEAKRDELFCRDWCFERDINFVSVTADVYGSCSVSARGL